MKNYPLIVVVLVALATTNNTIAQTYTFNWATSFATPWVAGSSASRTTANIGASGITATVSFSGPQSNAMSSFSGFSSPQVSSGGTPFTTQLGSNVPNLALGMNLSSKNDYVDMTVTFSAPVYNISFNVCDIDKNSNNTNTYFDQITVTGVYGSTPVANPVLTKLNGTATNIITDTVLINGNTAYSNTVNNRGGNTASSATEQNGTVKVNFGIALLTSITIRYQNYTGAQNNPADQAIGIGNMSFQKTSLLPVVLTSFAATEKTNSVELNWATAQETDLTKFIVEKSTDGINWQTLTVVAATGGNGSGQTYRVTDEQPVAVNYYRLKSVDASGSYEYSKIVSVRKNENDAVSVKVFPNPVTSTATISITSKSTATVHIKIFSSNGMLVKDLTSKLYTGTNNIGIPSANTLSNGMYTVIIENGERFLTTQFIKN